MADRLKQIWGEFAGRTNARLTSVDIDGVARPGAARRAEREGEPERAFEAGRGDRSHAVEAALNTLHAEIQAKAKRAGRRRGRAEISLSAEEPPMPPSGLDERLLADLKFTEARVRRGSSDYLTYAAQKQAAWQNRRRKKFLGLF